MLTPPAQPKLLLSLPTKRSENISSRSNNHVLNPLEGVFINIPSLHISGSFLQCQDGQQDVKPSPQKTHNYLNFKQKIANRSFSRLLSCKVALDKTLLTQSRSAYKRVVNDTSNQSRDKDRGMTPDKMKFRKSRKLKKPSPGLESAQSPLNAKLVLSSKNRPQSSHKSANQVNVKIAESSQPRIPLIQPPFESTVARHEAELLGNPPLDNKANRRMSKIKGENKSDLAGKGRNANPSSSYEMRDNSAKTREVNYYIRPVLHSCRPLSKNSGRYKDTTNKTGDEFFIAKPSSRTPQLARSVKPNRQSRRESPGKTRSHLDPETKFMLEDPFRYIGSLKHISNQSISNLQENLKRVPDQDLKQFVSQHGKDISYESRRKISDIFALNLIYSQIVNELEQRKKAQPTFEAKKAEKPVGSEKVRISPEISSKQLFCDSNKTYLKTPVKSNAMKCREQAKNTLNNGIQSKKGLLMQPLSGVINKRGLHSAKFNTLRQNIACKVEQRDLKPQDHHRTDPEDKSWMRRPLIVSTLQLESTATTEANLKVTTRDLSEGPRIGIRSVSRKPQSVWRKPPSANYLVESPMPVKLASSRVLLQKESDRSELIEEIKAYVSYRQRNPSTTKRFYRIEKEIADGFYGKVLLAYSVLAERPVAIKLFEKSRITSTGAAQKIQKEIATLKLVSDHPNVCQFYETFEDAQFIYVVLEYVAGGDLASWIKRSGRLNQNELLQLLRQMINALQLLQSKQLLHRDIKLDNILVTNKFEVKLCDFGIAVPIPPLQVLTEYVGTPVYLAPEVVSGKGYSGFKSDIWSLGVACYIALTGEVPFKGVSLEKLEESILCESLGFPEHIDINPKLKQTIKSMLEKNPEKRLSLTGIAHALGLSTQLQLEQTRIQLHLQTITAIKEMGFDYQSITNSLLKKDYNHITALYKILQTNPI